MNRLRMARTIVWILALAMIMIAALAPNLGAQTLQGAGSGPAEALNDALVAACEENTADFANYLTDENAASFQKLPADQRASLMQRFALVDTAGRPLLSSDDKGHEILRCEGTDSSAEFRFGTPRVHDNLSYVPVSVTNGNTIQFGFVRENGTWKLLSLGLLLIDIPQLQEQWAAQDIENREQTAIDTLQNLAAAIDTYKQAFGKLPNSLAQLGPAKDGISPDGAKLIDADLAAGNKDGYKFRYRITAAADGGEAGFEIAAIPAVYGKSGKRSFLLDKNEKIHAADKRGAVATADDPIVTTANPETQ
ncbi:MAG TPA: hypothetical protein VND42_05335 [Candidatus Acidoferrales bacterium]|nr:hypothetical protein [Candidatus Acidoferrales bacterium]